MCTYVQLRYAVRSNDIKTVNKIWRSTYPLFQATEKWKYAFLSIYVCFVTKLGHKSVRDVVNNRLVSLRGFSNYYIKPDCVTEKINLQGRYANSGSVISI